MSVEFELSQAPFRCSECGQGVCLTKRLYRKQRGIEPRVEERMIRAGRRSKSERSGGISQLFLCPLGRAFALEELVPTETEDAVQRTTTRYGGGEIAKCSAARVTRGAGACPTVQGEDTAMGRPETVA